MPYLKEHSLKEYTTFSLGGKAKYFCSASTKEEMREAFLFAKREVPLFCPWEGF